MPALPRDPISPDKTSPGFDFVRRERHQFIGTVPKPPLWKGRWRGTAAPEGLKYKWTAFAKSRRYKDNPSLSFADSSRYTREPGAT